jgi:DNA-binding winged helix-turn-helix (wHTH) protein
VITQWRVFSLFAALLDMGAMLHFQPETVTVSPGELEFGPFRLSVTTRSLYLGDEVVTLAPKAFEILRVLVEYEGQLVTKEEILQRVWPDTFAGEGSIATNISALRKILNPHFEGDGPIATVPRRGYVFAVPVQVRRARPQLAVVAALQPDRFASTAAAAIALSVVVGVIWFAAVMQVS